MSSADFEAEAVPHLDAVYRFALRLAGSPDGAGDLVQETFLRAHRSWDTYRPGTNCKSWLFTICRNVFLRQVERSRRYEEIVRAETGGAAGAGAAGAAGGPGGTGIELASPVWLSVIPSDPEGEFFDSIVDEEILRAVDDLPEEYRTAVVLSDLEGMSYAEIAETMEVPVGTVKSRLFRGRRLLQKALYDYAVETGRLPGKEDA